LTEAEITPGLQQDFDDWQESWQDREVTIKKHLQRNKTFSGMAASI
jgi:hypothetical protein